MNVIVKFQGREAIPIRALPFLAGFEEFTLVPILPPYMIAMAAAMPNEVSIGNSLATYAIENSKVRQLSAKEWGAVIEQTDRPLDQAVQELPAGVFVFADEFANWLKWFLQTNGHPFEDDQSILNPNPLIPDALQKIIMEGMSGNFCTSSTQQSFVKLKRGALIREFSLLMPSIDRDLREASRKSPDGTASLAELAKMGGGFWNVEAVMTWGKERGKIQRRDAEQYINVDPESIYSVVLKTVFNL